MKPYHYREVSETCCTCKHVSYPNTRHIWCTFHEFYIAEDGEYEDEIHVCDNWTEEVEE